MKEPPMNELIRILDYDKVSGIFRWKVKSCRMAIGSIAGYKRRDGYIQIVIKRNPYLAHRLAWIYEFGDLLDFDIDHINGIRCDNSISNLRKATRTQNNQNRKINKNSISGVKGVGWSSLKNKWVARCTVDGKRIYLGSFDDISSAENVVREFREKNHKSFFNHGGRYEKF